MSIACAALLAGSSFYVGIGPVSDHQMSMLTPGERCYIEQVIPQQIACSDQTCRDEFIGKLRDVVQFRRELRGSASSEYLFNIVRQPCEHMSDNIAQQAACFDELHLLNFEEVMALVGFTQSGVTRAGYAQLHMHMTMREVEYILGDMGEEVSYASHGGYSSAIYRWGTSRRSILVTFSNDELTGRTQLGL